VLEDERLELADELGMSPEREIRVDSLLERGEPQLLETSDLDLREGLVREVGERGTPPERQCLAEAVRVASLEQPLEPVEIELSRLEPDRVPRRAREDPVGAQDLPELRDVVLERVGGRARRLARPELVDEAVGGDDLCAPRQEQREHRPLPRAPERQLLPVGDDLERSQDAELHLSAPSQPLLTASIDRPAWKRSHTATARDKEQTMNDRISKKAFSAILVALAVAAFAAPGVGAARTNPGAIPSSLAQIQEPGSVSDFDTYSFVEPTGVYDVGVRYPTSARATGGGFAWGDAAVGGTFVLGLCLLGAGIQLAVRRQRLVAQPHA
jgi:hypothetical protein